MKEIMTGIIGDAEDLVKEHVALAKAELKDALVKAKTASISFGAAGAFAAVGLVFLLVTLALVLTAYTSLPLWGAFAIVTVLCLTVAGVTFAIAKAKLREIEEKPLSRTTEALKEDVTWLSRTLTHAP